MRDFVRWMSVATIALTIVLIASGSHAEDLVMLLNADEVRIEQVQGTGYSSGLALQGNLVNTSGRNLEIDVVPSSALYFANRQPGQNMVIVALLERDGSYYTLGNKAFVEVQRGATLPISLIAYCADFDLDNPQSNHTFAVSSLPTTLVGIAEAIRREEERNIEIGSDNTTALQVALWLAQGVSADEIRERYPFTAQEERLARDLIQSAN